MTDVIRAKLAPPSVYLDFVSQTITTGETSYERVGSRKIDMANHATAGSLTRTLYFEGTIESSTVTTVTSDVKLVNRTDNVDVTSATYTTTSASPQDFSIAITTGTSDGTIRTDAAKNYEVQLKRTGGAVSDVAILSNARVLVKYT